MNLKQIRTNQGLSVPTLSRLSGVPLRTIENVERTHDCRVSTAIKLANALNVTLDDLFMPYVSADESPIKDLKVSESLFYIQGASDLNASFLPELKELFPGSTIKRSGKVACIVTPESKTIYVIRNDGIWYKLPDR